MSNARPAVFLDRDGVINEVVTVDGVPRSPRTVDELEVVADAARLLTAVRDAGYLVIVVTNQPEIARGVISASAVERIHAELESRLPIDAVYCCPHDTGDGCSCRKPAPGMLLTAATDHSVDLGRSWLIGDRWVDVAAARAAGVTPILIDRPWSWDRTSSGDAPRGLDPDSHAPDLAAAVAAILAPRI
ncbi:MAG TPA: HAD family hydrolase [Acidimicrobiia bacterium]